MIPLDATHLIREIEAAEKLRNKVLNNAIKLVKKLVGNFYSDEMRGRPTPENMFFSYVAQVLPQLVFDNPQVTVAAKRIVSHESIASAMKMAVNGWIKETAVRDEFELAAIDMLVAFGVMKTGIEPRGDYMSNPDKGIFDRFQMSALTPFAIRVEPSSFILDSQCKHVRQARLIGQMFTRDLEDLRGDDRYDQAVVATMSADEDWKEVKGRIKGGAESDADDLRNKVTLYELYLPEHMSICTVAKSNSAKGAFVRPPAPYAGPDSGPFIMFGVYPVPDKPYPLSPLAAAAEQFMEMNAHASAASVEASTNKKLVVVDGNLPGGAASIMHTARSGDVISIPGFSGQGVTQVELGGTSEFRLAYLAQLRERTDRVMGLGDAQRGKAVGVTATEASIASSAASGRTEWMQMKYREAVKAVLGNAAWYLFYDPSVVAPVSYTDPVTGEPFEGVFLGGVQPGQEDANWLDFFLDIEPFSMQRIDPAVRGNQAKLLFDMAMQVGPVIPQIPWLNWRSILDFMGEAHNLPDFASRILNPMGMQLLGGGMLGQQPNAQFSAQDPNSMPVGANQQVLAGASGVPTAGVRGGTPGFGPRPQQGLRPGQSSGAGAGGGIMPAGGGNVSAM